MFEANKEYFYCFSWMKPKKIILKLAVWFDTKYAQTKSTDIKDEIQH